MPTKPAPKQHAKPQTKAIVPVVPREPIDPAMLEKALVGDDLGGLNPAQRMQYYDAVCRSLSLNPLTRPFQFTQIDGKLTLYARKDCAEQLRQRDGINIKIVERKTEDGVHSVVAKATNGKGREDEAIGAEPMVEPDYVLKWNPQTREKEPVENPIAGKPLSPASRAKALMKAETKAKRRVTLSIAGLGIPDETEIESIHADVAPIAHDDKVKNLGAVVETSNVSPATPKAESKAATWREYVVPGFSTESRFFNRALGDCHPKELRWLADWDGARNAHAAEIKAQVAIALEDPEVKAILAASGKPQEPAKAKTGTEAPPKEEKPAQRLPGGNEMASGAPAKDWKEVVIDLPKSRALHGRKLGDIAEAGKGAITIKDADEKIAKMCALCDGHEWLRTLVRQGIPALKDQAQIDAIRAAAKELGVFHDPAWLKRLDEKMLRTEILRRFAEHGMDDAKATVAIDDITNGTAISKLEEKILRFIVQHWEKIEKVIEGDKLP